MNKFKMTENEKAKFLHPSNPSMLSTRSKDTDTPETTEVLCSEMIERVARSLVAVNGGNPDFIAVSTNEEIWKSFVRDARASIKAMREPTAKMLEAGYDLDAPEYTPAEECWKTMIDVALQ